jgi:hypothetical protein
MEIINICVENNVRTEKSVFEKKIKAATAKSI